MATPRQRDSESRPRRILRTTAAADYIGLSASTLEKRRLLGNGPRFLRLGGRAIGYDVSDLDAWLDIQREAILEETAARPQGAPGASSSRT